MSSEEEMMEAAASALESSENAKEKIRNACMSRGYGGMSTLGRFFRRSDADGSGSISIEEFTSAITEIGLEMSEDEMAEIIQEFDAEGEGTLNYEEFLDAVRPELNETRMAVLDEAFASMDTSGDGKVTIEDFKEKYCLQHHPNVINNKFTEEEILMKMMNFLFGIEEYSGEADGEVTHKEFLDYYSGLSKSYEDDEQFVDMIKNSFSL